MHTTAHVWGFYDAAGHPKHPDGVAVDECSVYAMHRGVESNIIRHGGTIADLRVTRTLDGFLIATQFDTPAHNQTARIWHRIMRAQAPWPSSVTTTEES